MKERGYNQYDGALTQALSHAAAYGVDHIARDYADVFLRGRSFLDRLVETSDTAHFAAISPLRLFPDHLRLQMIFCLNTLQKRDSTFARYIETAGDIARPLEFKHSGVKQINAYNKPNPAQASLWAGFGTALTVLPTCAIFEQLYGKEGFDGLRAALTLADTHASKLHLLSGGLLGTDESREMPLFGLVQPGAKIRGRVVGLNEKWLSVLRWRESHGCPILHPPQPGVHAGLIYQDQRLPESTIHTLYTKVVQPALEHHITSWGSPGDRLREIAHHDLLVLSGQHPDLPRPNGVQIHPIWEMPPIAGRFIPRR